MNVAHPPFRGDTSPESSPNRDGSSRGARAVTAYPERASNPHGAPHQGILRPFLVEAEPVGSDPYRGGTGKGAEPYRASSVPNEDRTSPEASPECPHDVPAWAYETDTRNPRAYGQCQRCRSYVVVLLPPQAGGWNSYGYDAPDWIIDEAKACPTSVIVDAVEGWLKKPYWAQHVRDDVFQRHQQWFSERAVEEIRREFKRKYELESLDVQKLRDEVKCLERDRLSLILEVGRIEERLRTLRRRLRKVAVPLVESTRARGVPVLAMEQSAPTYVYALAASDAPTQYRYVGSTDTPQHRLNQHLSAKAAPRVRAWVEEVHARRASVVMLELWKGADRQEGYDVEAALIADYTALGMADLNTTSFKRGTAA